MRRRKHTALRDPMWYFGKYAAGIYCGESVWRVRHWYKHYGLYRKVVDGFSLGPLLVVRVKE